ncbi:DNA-directed RNA polymerase subunit beta [bacterium]|nr:DNA-directed RNA polymerase subunit beta [bacterium]
MMGILGQQNYRTRKWFGKVAKNVTDIPDLLEVQKASFQELLQKDVAPADRKKIGLHNAFLSIFPITSFNNAIELSYLGYSIGEPQYDVDECKLRGTTYELPLKIKAALASYDIDENGNRSKLNSIMEQEVHFGSIPCMTDWGTFIINGTERVIVNQLHRSPGTFFDCDKNKTTSGNEVYAARLIPYHGSWLDFEFDSKRLLYVKIDRKKKILATIFLKAWGYTTQEIVSAFYIPEKIAVHDGVLAKVVSRDDANLSKQKVPVDVMGPEDKEIAKEGKKFSTGILKRLEAAGISEIMLPAEYLLGKRLYAPVCDPKTGEVFANVNDEINATLLDNIIKKGVTEFSIIYFENMNYSAYFSNTLKVDKVPADKDGKFSDISDSYIGRKENNWRLTEAQKEALLEIYRMMVPSNPVKPEVAAGYFKNTFLNPENYDLSEVGRLRMNYKFKEDVPLTERQLRREDVMNSVIRLLELTDGRGKVDDIDHLGNRRVRLVGELLEDVFKTGLLKMSHSIKEKIASGSPENNQSPYEVISYKQVSAVLKDFFATGQLSQFMDHTNVLSEMTHKRRLSALGPGGLTREHAGFEVRDVHRTHYGRICPVETPEGPNVGLIVSLTTFARIDKFGYIETPYRVVKNCKVTDEVVYLDAIKEETEVIMPSSVKLDKNGKIIDEIVNARKDGEPVRVPREEITLVDLVPVQLVSVSAALIPFLEHDDANRALMGSNMQRQAVPLIRTDAPLVGTGMERYVARDSGYTLFAQRNGTVVKVDSSRIVVKVEEDNNVDVDIYNLIKFKRSNQNTAINQRPVVSVGDFVRKGDVIADGPAINRGELALGKNVLIAFMPWNGYNYEDSVLINRRLLKDDYYTSVHIEEFICEARDTKRGPEEITADIPNASDEILRKLDESGIIRIGQKIKPGDILVGKVTPKGETVLTPEEKLLRAIFGEKAGDVKDNSLYVHPGTEGVVIDTRIFSRKGTKKDNRMKEQQQEQMDAVKRNRDDEVRIIEKHTYELIRKMFVGKKTDADLKNEKDAVVVKKGTELTPEILATIPESLLGAVSVKDRELLKNAKELFLNMNRKVDMVKKIYDNKMKQITRDDDLTPGVVKSVKVFVAVKRKLSVGDKMSGRHGNKGVVSMLLPEEDVPYMEDGRTVDIVLNPLGVPSRMNIGQIFEVHLGLGARKLGEQINRYMEENYGVDKLRAKLKEILDPSEEVSKLIDEASEDDVRSFIKSMKGGIYTATPVFDGAQESEIRDILKKTGERENGKMILFDGRTGEPFESDVTVGVMYFLKLHHLVDEKVHARSTGPYSLVTQQPLGGKAQFGGQRLGEMEVWALGAYGAAYCLQEFLTVKSDDVEGRKKLYEAIVRGKTKYEMGIPASFSVLVKEMQSLCLNVNLIEDNNR